MKRRRRGNSEGSVYRRKDGRWVGSITIGFDPDGTQRRKDFYAQTRAEVVSKLDDARQAHAEGRPVTPERQTLSQFLDRWLSDVVIPSVSPKTREFYQCLVAQHIKPALGHIELGKLHAQHVQEFVGDASAAGLSPTSVKHCRDTLRAALNVAMRWNLISRNPATLVSLPRRVRPNPATFSLVEVQTFIDAARGHRLESLFTLALVTGAREGELLGLRWADFDQTGRLLHISGSVHRIRKEPLRRRPTKNEESQRSIRLPRVAVLALIEHRRRQQAEREWCGSRWKESGHIFTTTIGTILDPRKMLSEYYMIRDRAKLRKLRFHDLRHSAATLLRAKGVPTPAISKLLGHASTRTTEEVYSHVNLEMEDLAADTMDRLLLPAKKPAGRAGLGASARKFRG